MQVNDYIIHRFSSQKGKDPEIGLPLFFHVFVHGKRSQAFIYM